MLKVFKVIWNYVSEHKEESFFVLIVCILTRLTFSLLFDDKTYIFPLKRMKSFPVSANPYVVFYRKSFKKTRCQEKHKKIEFGKTLHNLNIDLDRIYIKHSLFFYTITRMQLRMIKELEIPSAPQCIAFFSSNVSYLYTKILCYIFVLRNIFVVRLTKVFNNKH